jgi:hypothetical protein
MVSDFDGDDCIFSLLTRGEVKGRRQNVCLWHKADLLDRPRYASN